MFGASWRRTAGRVAVGVLLAVAALRVHAERPVDERAFRALDGPVAAGAHIGLGPLTLDDGADVELDVSPFEVFAPGAVFVIHGKFGDTFAQAPTDRWYTGRVVGDPSSVVVLARGRAV